MKPLYAVVIWTVQGSSPAYSKQSQACPYHNDHQTYTGCPAAVFPPAITREVEICIAVILWLQQRFVRRIQTTSSSGLTMPQTMPASTSLRHVTFAFTPAGCEPRIFRLCAEPQVHARGTLFMISRRGVGIIWHHLYEAQVR